MYVYVYIHLFVCIYMRCILLRISAYLGARCGLYIPPLADSTGKRPAPYCERVGCHVLTSGVYRLEGEIRTGEFRLPLVQAEFHDTRTE